MIQAIYHGRVFVPAQPVDLPAGTQVSIVVPVQATWNPPPPMTPGEEEQWQETLKQIQSSAPEFPTLDDAMRYLRKRP